MPEEEEERSRTSPRVLSSLGLEDDRKVCFNQRKKASVLPVSLPGALMCLPLVIPGPAGRVRACTLSSRTSGAPVNETQPFVWLLLWGADATQRAGAVLYVLMFLSLSF